MKPMKPMMGWKVAVNSLKSGFPKAGGLPSAFSCQTGAAAGVLI
jgi:hypothetical protein